MQTCQVRCKGQILHYHVSLAGIPGPFPYRRSKSTLFSECQSKEGVEKPFYRVILSACHSERSEESQAFQRDSSSPSTPQNDYGEFFNSLWKAASLKGNRLDFFGDS